MTVDAVDLLLRLDGVREALTAERERVFGRIAEIDDHIELLRDLERIAMRKPTASMLPAFHVQGEAARVLAELGEQLENRPGEGEVRRLEVAVHDAEPDPVTETDLEALVGPPVAGPALWELAHAERTRDAAPRRVLSVLQGQGRWIPDLPPSLADPRASQRRRGRRAPAAPASPPAPRPQLQSPLQVPPPPLPAADPTPYGTPSVADAAATPPRLAPKAALVRLSPCSAQPAGSAPPMAANHKGKTAPTFAQNRPEATSSAGAKTGTKERRHGTLGLAGHAMQEKRGRGRLPKLLLDPNHEAEPDAHGAWKPAPAVVPKEQTPPMLVQTLPVEKLKQHLDLFVCVPMEGARLSAGACVKRQTVARGGYGEGEPLCRACELGEKVAERIGAELPARLADSLKRGSRSSPASRHGS